ncbi:MAG: hypothetical protein N3A01_08010 [Bacteroidales bacterium]|nr:hypothetical protein [Bacteroidales bacterium]
MKTIVFSIPFIFVLIFGFMRCSKKEVAKETFNEKISVETIKYVIDSLIKIRGEHCRLQIEKGVKQLATFWENSDNEEFKNFCFTYYAKSDSDQYKLFMRLSKNFETIYGHFNKITIELLKPTHLTSEELLPIDEIFSGYSVSSHFKEDMFKNKIAHITMLNFPTYSLDEKNLMGKSWTRLQWAYARMGDLFTSLVPAEIEQKISEAIAKADNYIANYNIYMGNVYSENKEILFPSDMKLISHWNLRDEIKASYADNKNGYEKQKTIYQVMKHIICQTIPSEVINNKNYLWDPFKNKVYDQSNKEINFKSEPNVRYEHIINIFRAIKEVDKYDKFHNTYIKRKFEAETEIPVEQIEQLFIEYISSPLMKQIGKLISQRLNRKLEPFDIWYDGFKARSTISQDELSKKTKSLFPDNKAFAKYMPTLLIKLGFNKEKAEYIASKIVVEPARGAGHAWGSEMRGDVAHLRTRINADGMDYKGYNIAIHELGHNVEQTLSLYDVDYYMLRGVPNTAFTEACAFLFQKRDLNLIDINDNTPQKEYLNILDIAWSLYEIIGVALVDIEMWKYMYANPSVNPEALKEKVISIAKNIWNKYYYPVFNIKDEPILAIYSHMINAPLYLHAYPLGHIIEYQIEDYIKNKNFANEILRMYTQGRLTPQLWMIKAVGNNISTSSLLENVKIALEKVK